MHCSESLASTQRRVGSYANDECKYAEEDIREDNKTHTTRGETELIEPVGYAHDNEQCRQGGQRSYQRLFAPKERLVLPHRLPNLAPLGWIHGESGRDEVEEEPADLKHRALRR